MLLTCGLPVLSATRSRGLLAILLLGRLVLIAVICYRGTWRNTILAFMLNHRDMKVNQRCSQIMQYYFIK